MSTVANRPMPAPHHPAAIDEIHLRPQAVTRSWARELRSWAQWYAPTPEAAAAARKAAGLADKLRRALEEAERAAA